MADFRALAVQYMATDNESEMREITSRAAKEIHDSGANRALVVGWVEAVRPWMESMQDDDLDLIGRAKALRFLADTLRAIPDNSLKASQVELLVNFFKVQLSLTEKVGILESTTALRELSNQSGCKPSQRVGIIEAIGQLGDDFSRQAAPTRLRIYELLLSFIQDDAVRAELGEKFGGSCSFVRDLVELCHLEKDPQNLVIWFKIQRAILLQYSPPAEVTKQLFESFSAFFPISLRRETSAGEVTVDDLKEGLRNCFAAHGKLSSLAFPFLLKKLDQGDALTVAVKVDILRTLQACASAYGDVENDIVPFIPGIWSSLKYEVRNGEIEESIEATLQVFRAVIQRLDKSTARKSEANLRKDFCDLIFNDVREDLSSTTYGRGAGRILAAVLGANMAVFSSEAPRILHALRKALDVKSPAHTIDVLFVLNSILKTRSALVEGEVGGGEIQDNPREEALDSIESLFRSVYRPVLKEYWGLPNLLEPQLKCLQSAIEGLALLASQILRSGRGVSSLVCGPDVCDEICLELFEHALSNKVFGLYTATPAADLEEFSVPALRTVVAHYRKGFKPLVEKVIGELRSGGWLALEPTAGPAPRILRSLRHMISRLAYIGCSQIPANIRSGPEEQSPALDNFRALILACLNLIFESLQDKVDPRVSPIAAFGVNAAIANFRDACRVEGKLPQPPPYFRGQLVSVESDLDAWRIAIDQQPAPSSAALEDVYSTYLHISYCTVRFLYQSVVKKLQLPPGVEEPQIGLNLPPKQDLECQDLFLNQLASIACHAIRQLSAGAQKDLGLGREAFRLFATESAGSPPRLSKHDNGRLCILSLGILQGLWPAAMADMTSRDGSAFRVLTQLPTFDLGDDAQPRELRIINSIQMVLANKYQRGQLTPGFPFRPASTVIDFWKKALCEDILDNPIRERNLSFMVVDGALAVAAGFAARREDAVKGLAPLISQLLGIRNTAGEKKPHSQGGVEGWSIGEYTARRMAIFVEELGPLSRDNHAVLSPLYKQWAYTTFIKPAMAIALSQGGPPNSDRQELIKNSRIAVLEMLPHVDFGIYEDDVKDVLRVLLVTVPTISVTATNDLLASLRMLNKVLEYSPDTIKEHIRTVTEICVKAYDAPVDPDAWEKKANPQLAKLTAIQILARLPTIFQIAALLPHSSPIYRAMILASGSEIREIRRAAIAGRKNWSRVH